MYRQLANFAGSKRYFNIAVICSLIMISLLLAGCDRNFPIQNGLSDMPSSDSQSIVSDSDILPSTRDMQTDVYIGQEISGQTGTDLEQAQEAALTHAGLTGADVTFIAEQLDYDDGIARYEIEFVTDTTKYEYEIKADDGTILEVSQEPVVQDILTLEDAKAAALAYAGVEEHLVSYTKLELDNDDGKPEYEIEFYSNGKEYSVKLDAVTGTILEMEMK